MIVENKKTPSEALQFTANLDNRNLDKTIVPTSISGRYLPELVSNTYTVEHIFSKSITACTLLSKSDTRFLGLTNPRPTHQALSLAERELYNGVQEGPYKESSSRTPIS